VAHHSNFDFYININEIPPEQNKFMAMLEYAFMERIRCNKITVVVLTGDTSEGKSSISQALIEEFCRMQNIKYADFVNDVTIYTPLEYPEKQKALLFDERLKDIQFMIIDEGRLVVRAKDWFSYINQVIADIFAMQRRIKRLMIIINTQSLEDIDKDLRRRITFWGIVYRPLHEKARLYLSRFWDDMRDPENIRLKKRMFKGIVEEDGVRKVLSVPFIKFPMPSKEVWDKYDENSYTAKASILKKTELKTSSGSSETKEKFCPKKPKKLVATEKLTNSTTIIIPINSSNFFFNSLKCSSKVIKPFMSTHSKFLKKLKPIH